MAARLTLKKIFKKSFERTFAIDGIQFDESNFNKVVIVNARLFAFDEGYQWAIIKEYYSHPITRLTAFMGIPNRPLNIIKKQSWANILNNIIGWQENVSSFQKNVNLFFIPIVLLFNLINIPFKLLNNILKLLTEFLPYVLSESLFLAREKLTNSIHFEEHPIVRLSVEGLAALLFALGWAARLSYWIGRCLTSPFQNFNEAWMAGKKNFGPGFMGYLAGTLFVSLSILFSIVTYSFLFPLAAKVLMAQILPELATHLPSLLIHAGNMFSKLMTPSLIEISKFFLPHHANAVQGLAIIAGIGMPTVMNGFYSMTKKLSDWWHRPVHDGRYKKIEHSDNEENDINIFRRTLAYFKKNSTTNLLKRFNDSSPKKDNAHSLKTDFTSPGIERISSDVFVKPHPSVPRKAYSEDLEKYRETLIEEEPTMSSSRSPSLGSFSSI